MSNELDAGFFDRADAAIHLANRQLADTDTGKVSASLLYAAARFNAWVSACGFENGPDMAKHRDQTIDYFVSEYRKMLTENLDDYIANFGPYMRPEDETSH